MKRSSAKLIPRRANSFTLVELLVVIAILALLATLAMPAFNRALQRAMSLRCAANLHAIGAAAALAAADNNNKYPEINNGGTASVYPDGTATNLIGALGPYGVTTNMLECPVDLQMGAASAFKKYQGSSYEWDPVFDDELQNQTVVYITPTVTVPVNSYRVRLAMDFNPIHRGRPNVVYGDGHVTSH